jgi:PAS domain S-box-containing protein
VRLIGSIIDLTEERINKEFLEYHANLLKEVSDAVISTDELFVVKSWNEAAEKTYGWSREEAIGKSIRNLITTYYDETSPEEALEVSINKRRMERRGDSGNRIQWEA